MKSVILMLALFGMVNATGANITGALAQKQFTDGVGGFSYTIPKDWQAKAIKGSKYQVLFTAASNQFAPNLNFVSETFYGSTLEYFKSNKNGIAKAFAGSLIVNESSLTSLGLGQIYSLTIKRSEASSALIQTFYIYGQGKGHSKWVATCSRLERQPASIDSACLSVIKSLKFK
jgi:hypothetical protein